MNFCRAYRQFIDKNATDKYCQDVTTWSLYLEMAKVSWFRGQQGYIPVQVLRKDKVPSFFSGKDFSVFLMKNE